MSRSVLRILLKPREMLFSVCRLNILKMGEYMQKARKKAFTLTELLVVVIVIGVLAAVTLPTFNKVLETRKTTEAEDVLSALRTEQEYRCAMEKPYATDLSKLDTLASNTSKNFKYVINAEGTPKKGTGTRAISQGKYNYTLEMPSYADGRICCVGKDCDKLNKDYPTCASLIASADFKPVPDNCSPEVDDATGNGANPISPSCGPRPDNLIKYQQCQDTNKCGREVKLPVCDMSTDWQWEEGNDWDASGCTYHDTKATEVCDGKDDKCGKIEYESQCVAAGTDNWEWKDVAISQCEKKPEGDLTEECWDGSTRTGSYECKDEAWEQVWDRECPEEETITCSEARQKLRLRRYCRDFHFSSEKNFTENSRAKVSKDIDIRGFWKECCSCAAGKRMDDPDGGTWSKCVINAPEAVASQFVAFKGKIYHPRSTKWCVYCGLKNKGGVIDYLAGDTITRTCSSQKEAQQMCNWECPTDGSACTAACVLPSALARAETEYNGKTLGFGIPKLIQVKEAYFDGECTYTYHNCAECPSSASQDYLLNGVQPDGWSATGSECEQGGDSLEDLQQRKACLDQYESDWATMDEYYDSEYSQPCEGTATTYQEALDAHPDCMVNFSGCANFHEAQYESISCSCSSYRGGSLEGTKCMVPAVYLPNNIGWTCGGYNVNEPCSQYNGWGYDIGENVVVATESPAQGTTESVPGFSPDGN